MYYIIATYKVKNRLTALKLFNPETKEIRMEPKSVVFKNAMDGTEVYIGLGKKVNSYGEEVVDIIKHDINVLHLDEVDEIGNPIDNRQSKLIISIKGFGSSIKATVVDSMGKLHNIDYNEFMQLLDTGKIVGAKRRPYDQILYHKHIIREGLVLSN